MRELKYLLAVIIVTTLVLDVPTHAQSVIEQLREGHKKEKAGDLDGAIQVYQEITANTEANQRHTAQAYYRIGMCYLKKGDKDNAQQQFQRLVSEFPRKLTAVANARRELRKIWRQERSEQMKRIRSGVPGRGLTKTNLVSPKGPPVVASTTPANFTDNVPADLRQISVTFDQQMIDKSWSWTQLDKRTFPKMVGQPRYDRDGRTCTLGVKLKAGMVYFVGINYNPLESSLSALGETRLHRGFKSTSGKEAKPYALVFATSDVMGRPTAIPEEMLAKAKAINAGKEPAEPKGVDTIEGTWLGTLKLTVMELRLVFKISKRPDGTLTATLDIPDQRAKDIPADRVTFKNGRLHVEVKSIMGVLDGRMAMDGSTIEGLWKQAGQSTPITLQRLGGAPESTKSELEMLGQELAHEDGFDKGKKKVFGLDDEYYVRFKTPKPNSYLKAVRIFHMCPSESESGKDNFRVLVCDANFTVIRDFKFRLNECESGVMDWLTLPIEPTKVPLEFAVGLTNPDRVLLIGYSPGIGGNSFFRLPRTGIRPYIRSNWLIRAIVSESPEPPRPIKPKRPIPKFKLPEFEWPDHKEFLGGEYGPVEKIKLKILGVTDEAIEDVITDKLSKMTDRSEYQLGWKRKGSILNVELSPVKNIEAFAKKIDFGTVVGTEGRELTIEAKKDWQDEDFRFGDDPERTVKLKIIGVTEDAVEEQIIGKLKKMTDEGEHLMTWHRTDDTLTVQLSPVKNVDTFVKKIDFGNVTSKRGRRIVVRAGKTSR